MWAFGNSVQRRAVKSLIARETLFGDDTENPADVAATDAESDPARKRKTAA